jgi:hypothetical protein
LSERAFWRLNFEEFHALTECFHEALDFAEYYAALPASAIYNVNRKPHTSALMPQDVMWQQKARKGNSMAPAPAPMRYAYPGERPPSARPPGTPDDLIDRFDIYARRLKRAERIN